MCKKESEQSKNSKTTRLYCLPVNMILFLSSNSNSHSLGPKMTHIKSSWQADIQKFRIIEVSFAGESKPSKPCHGCITGSCFKILPTKCSVTEISLFINNHVDFKIDKMLSGNKCYPVCCFIDNHSFPFLLYFSSLFVHWLDDQIFILFWIVLHSTRNHKSLHRAKYPLFLISVSIQTMKHKIFFSLILELQLLVKHSALLVTLTAPFKGASKGAK